MVGAASRAEKPLGTWPRGRHRRIADRASRDFVGFYCDLVMDFMYSVFPPTVMHRRGFYYSRLVV